MTDPTPPATTLGDVASVAAEAAMDLARIARTAGGTEFEFSDGRLYVAGVTQTALNKALATLSGQAAASARILTPLEFMDRFEEAEEDRIIVAAAQAAANGQPQLQRFLSRLAAAGEVRLDHPDVLAGMDALVVAKLLTRKRATAILAG